MADVDTAADDRRFLEASSLLLARLSSDPDFVRRFDQDSVSAMQELFPELRKEPKEKIQAALDADRQTNEQLARLATSNNFTPVAGILSFLSGIINTRFVQAVVAAIAGALAARLVRAPPPPAE
jgi:hypothetical protein